jgi:hypothetical protein
MIHLALADDGTVLAYFARFEHAAECCALIRAAHVPFNSDRRAPPPVGSRYDATAPSPPEIESGGPSKPSPVPKFSGDDTMRTLYVYDSETGNLVGRIHGDTNDACEAKADEMYGSNDVEWCYTQKSELEFDGDAEDHYVGQRPPAA